MPFSDGLGNPQSKTRERDRKLRESVKLPSASSQEQNAAGIIYPELLTPRETAKILRTTEGNLAKKRCVSPSWGPRFYRIGSKIFYDAADTARFIISCRVGGERPKPDAT